MERYLLIESRDPFEAAPAAHSYALAASLARAGNDVQLFLVENGVLAARAGGAAADGLGAAARAGAAVLADDFSLRERGITSDRLITDVKVTPLDTVVDGLVEGRKTLWN